MTPEPLAGTGVATSPFVDRREALERCARMGVAEAVFTRHERILAAALGAPARPGDVLWSLANRRLVSAGRQGDWQAVASTYLEMAALLQAEGRSAEAVLGEAHRALLLVP